MSALVIGAVLGWAAVRGDEHCAALCAPPAGALVGSNAYWLGSRMLDAPILIPDLLRGAGKIAGCFCALGSRR